MMRIVSVKGIRILGENCIFNKNSSSRGVPDYLCRGRRGDLFQKPLKYIIQIASPRLRWGLAMTFLIRIEASEGAPTIATVRKGFLTAPCDVRNPFLTEIIAGGI